MRSKSEIDKQISRLNKLKNELPEFNFFGDNNHAIINAKLDVLEGVMSSEDEIYECEEEYGQLGDSGVSEVIGVLEWMEGDNEEAPVPDGCLDEDSIKFDINKASELIDFPIDKWEGNCHGVASKIVESGMIDGKVERGYWKGKVAKGSIFYGKPLIPHSWIRMSDGQIADPTRWCFGCEEPYIFVGGDKDYDVGGNEFRKANMKPCPAFNTKDKPAKLTLTKSCKKFVMDLINNAPFITTNHVFWLANLPLDVLSPYAKEIYTALEGSSFKTFIPIDNYNIIMQ